jgi:ATP-dependent RNA helicase RhlE
LSFNHLNLIEPLLKALDNEGYTIPTPIQEQAIPIILDRKDLLGCAQTGTGKTAAFALPILQLLCEDSAGLKEETRPGATRPIRTLVLTPTRELAIQIDDSFAAYGKYTGMRHTVIFGGVPQHSQVQALREGVDILVATPGRLLDLIDQRHINLQYIKYFVLDEADRMLDMGFIHDVRKLLTKLPQKKHSLFFSATMPPEIQKLANTILVNPSKVEVTPESTTAETVQQSLYFVEKKDKRSLLLHILKDTDIPTALVFTRTKHGADKVAQGLVRAGIRAEAIHGNKSQNARQNALQNFKSRHTRILVATDIAARGIDIDELTHVINYELPNVPETYVHRIGRTGRAGASGIALSFCDQEETEFLRDIQKLIAKPIPVVEDHPHVMHASLSYRAPVVASSGAGVRDRSGNGRRESSGAGNGRRGPSNGRRESSGSGNGRREHSGNGRPDRSGPVNGRPAVEIKRAVQAPGQQPDQASQPSRRLEIKRPEQQPEQQQEPKRELQREPQQEHKREPQREAQREPRREPQHEPKREPQRDRQLPEDTSLPVRINQSEGDEKW